MTDIVERLRNIGYQEPNYNLRMEAAQEIERLEQEIERLEGVCRRYRELVEDIVKGLRELQRHR